jgi:prephenate dehydratase
MVPAENTPADSVVRVFDLLLVSSLQIVAETILPIEHHLSGWSRATLADILSVAPHPMALAQCERLFTDHPSWKRVPAEDTAGSVRKVLARQDKSLAAIAGQRGTDHYRGVALARSVQDNAENFHASCFSFLKARPLRKSPQRP